jgi:hypothetical protein
MSKLIWITILGILSSGAFCASFREAKLSSGEKIIISEDGRYIPESVLISNCSSTITCLRASGWRYIAPTPKSHQAAWGNYDRRTTWYYGHWTNGTDFSDSQPKVQVFHGRYLVIGDGINNSRYYRNGGSPAGLSKIEMQLCTNCD